MNWQILQLSGLGPKAVLEAAGVEQISELAVGENLQDHILVPLVFETINDSKPMSEARALTPDQMVEYQLLDGTGFLSSSGVDMMAFWLTEEGKKQGYTFNDAQIHALQGQPLNEALALNLGTDYETHWAGVPEDGVYLAPSLLHPKSVGSIEIKSDDPLTHPTIHARYCSQLQCQRASLSPLTHAAGWPEQIPDRPIRRRGDDRDLQDDDEDDGDAQLEEDDR